MDIVWQCTVHSNVLSKCKCNMIGREDLDRTQSQELRSIEPRGPALLWQRPSPTIRYSRKTCSALFKISTSNYTAVVGENGKSRNIRWSHCGYYQTRATIHRKRWWPCIGWIGSCTQTETETLLVLGIDSWWITMDVSMCIPIWMTQRRGGLNLSNATQFVWEIWLNFCNNVQSTSNSKTSTLSNTTLDAYEQTRITNTGITRLKARYIQIGNIKGVVFNSPEKKTNHVFLDSVPPNGQFKGSVKNFDPPMSFY